MTADTATIVIVDPTNTVADGLRESLGDSTTCEVSSVPTITEARTLLDSVNPACVVLRLDSVTDSAGQLLVSSARPDCPVILLTNGDRELVDDELLTRNTTLVEWTADSDTWGFLSEKIQRHLRATPKTKHDEELYRTLVESARDGLYRLDANGHLVYANDSWADILGYERDEIIGSHASIAMAEGELERGQQTIQQVLDDADRESDIIDLGMTTKAGENITVAVHFVVLTTDDGTYDGVMGVARDVTERRRDKERLTAKNERLDEFASVVSHDLRNPLNVATGRVELLSEDVDSEHIAPIERSLTRMEDLIENLLTLARIGEQVTAPESVTLGQVAEQCWRTVGTEKALTVDTDRSIRADQTRLKQLLENLVRNAVEHAGESATVRIGDLPEGFYLSDDAPVSHTRRELEYLIAAI